MNIIKRTYNQYIDDSSFVYKSCQREWIVILKKISETITNESRPTLDSFFAKYRANKLRVILIFNKFDPQKTLRRITNSVYKSDTIVYEQDRIVRAKSFDDDILSVCSRGIHYFKSIECAYYYEINHIRLYTGEYISRHDNGALWMKGEYKNGKKIGYWTYYHPNSTISRTTMYENGVKDGIQIRYDLSGKIYRSSSYDRGYRVKTQLAIY